MALVLFEFTLSGFLTGICAAVGKGGAAFGTVGAAFGTVGEAFSAVEEPAFLYGLVRLVAPVVFGTTFSGDWCTSIGESTIGWPAKASASAAFMNFWYL